MVGHTDWPLSCPPLALRADTAARRQEEAKQKAAVEEKDRVSIVFLWLHRLPGDHARMHMLVLANGCPLTRGGRAVTNECTDSTQAEAAEALRKENERLEQEVGASACAYAYIHVHRCMNACFYVFMDVCMHAYVDDAEQ